MHRPVTNVTLL